MHLDSICDGSLIEHESWFPFFLPENLALSFAIFSGSVGLSSKTPQQSLSLGKSSPRERVIKGSVCLWFFLASVCRWRHRKGQSPQPTHNPVVQLSNFPQAVELVIGALKGDFLMAPTGGGECRPFTYTMRQMSYLLSLEKWVARHAVFWEHSLSLWLHFSPVSSPDRTVLEFKVMAEALVHQRAFNGR